MAEQTTELPFLNLFKPSASSVEALPSGHLILFLSLQLMSINHHVEHQLVVALLHVF